MFLRGATHERVQQEYLDKPRTYDGCEVRDPLGKKIGFVEENLAHFNDEPEYFRIRIGFFGLRSTLLPVQLVAASMLVLAACGGPAGQGRDSAADRPDATRPEKTAAPTATKEPTHKPGVLAGTAWSLAELGGRALVEGTEITLRFRNGGLGGEAGCNSYHAGEVGIGKETIRPSTLSATQMACGKTGGVMAQERRYLRALSGAATYRVEGDRLEIRDGAGKKALLFEKEEG